jgi:Flp pilus assembly protein TadB
MNDMSSFIDTILYSIKSIITIFGDLMRENMLIFFLFIIAFLLIISSLLYTGKRVGLKKTRSIKYIKAYKNVEELIDRFSFLKRQRDRITTDLALITSKDDKTNEKIANYIFYIFSCVSIILFAISLIAVKFLILKFVLPSILVVLIIFVFNIEVSRRKRKAQNTFGKVINVYTRKYSKHLEIRKAFQDSIKHIPTIHQYEFTRLISSMTSPSQYEKALNNYAKRINTPLAFSFIELLLVSLYDNKNILLGLIDLENLIASEKKAEKRKANRLQDKKSNIYLAMFCMIGAIIVTYFFLGSSALNFYFNTFTGQALILLSLVVVAITLLCLYVYDRIL